MPVLTGPFWDLSFSADKAFIEGDFPQNYGDRHMLVTDTSDCRSTEFIQTSRPGLFGNILSNGGYEFGAAGATEWDLTSNAIHRGYNNDFSGVNAPKSTMAASIVRRDEMNDGASSTYDGRNDDTPLDHSLGFCLPKSLVKNSYRWPATSSDGTNTTDATAPEMGSRIRLKSSVTLSGLAARTGGSGWTATTAISATNSTKVGYTEGIFKALQVYGMVLADSCVNNWSIAGAPDSRWTDAELTALQTLRLSDFELVDTEPMRAVTGSLSIGTSQPTLESRWFEVK